MNQAEVARARQELIEARGYTLRALDTVREVLNDPRLAACWHDDLSRARRMLNEAMRLGANADHRLALHARLDSAGGFTMEEAANGLKALGQAGISVVTDERLPEGVAVATCDRLTFSPNMDDLDRGRLWQSVIEHQRKAGPDAPIVTDGDGYVQVQRYWRVHLDTYRSIAQLYPYLTPHDLPLSASGLSVDDVIAATRAMYAERFRNLKPGDTYFFTEDGVTEAGTIRENHTIYPGMGKVKRLPYGLDDAHVAPMPGTAARDAYDRMVARGTFPCLVIDLWQWLRGRVPR